MALWLGVMLLYSYALFWGLRKGSVLCITVCAPGLVPYVTEKGKGWRGGLWAGILFNIPRILILAALGAAVGLASFTLVNNERFIGATEGIGIIGYVVVGCILTVYGLYTFMMALEEQEDIKEGREPVCKNKGMPHSRFSVWAARRLSSGDGDPFLLLWGSVLGLACIGETVLTLESAMLSGTVASLAASPASAALLGASVMFFFGVGAAIPVIMVTTASGGLGERITSRERVIKIKLASSAVMMLVGLGLLMLFGARFLG